MCPLCNAKSHPWSCQRSQGGNPHCFADPRRTWYPIAYRYALLLHTYEMLMSVHMLHDNLHTRSINFFSWSFVTLGMYSIKFLYVKDDLLRSSCCLSNIDDNINFWPILDGGLTQIRWESFIKGNIFGNNTLIYVFSCTKVKNWSSTEGISDF